MTNWKYKCGGTYQTTEQQLLKRGLTNEQITYNNSLIGRKIMWKNIEYTIIDKHNFGDYVLIDDDNMSMISLHWENVKLIN